MKLTKKTKIAIIGAGKFASSLYPALIERDYLVEYIISRNISSAKKLARTPRNSTVNKSLVKAIPVLSDNYSVLKNFKGTIFITVPDSALESVAKDLSGYNLLFKDCFFVHTSGTLSTSVLNSLKKKKALTGSLHILNSFPSLKRVNIKGSYSAIESESNEGIGYLKKLSTSLALIPFQISKEEKIKYHLAAVFAANFLNAVLYGSAKLFSEIKNRPADHFTVFEPIVMSVINHIKKEGAAAALSGPVERGDIKTIKEHLSFLGKGDRELFASYIANSLLLIEAATEKYSLLNKIKPPNTIEIKKLLIKELKK